MVISPKWGSCSEVTFTIYKEVNSTKNFCYDRIKKNKLLHIDGFGYFTIISDDEEFEDKIPHKSIDAYSAEYLLNNKGVNLTFVTTAGDINSTSSTTVITSNYFFYRKSQPEKSLMHQLIKIAPQWSIGYISSSLKSKSRSFSETDKGLYGFLTNEVAQSYEALFVFDNENYTINAYDTSEVIKNTNIILSFDNLIKNATVSELSDDIFTVLNVSGAEDLSIAKVNPNGTKKLFCLDYYTGVLDKNATNYYETYNEWITNNALKKKVLDWEKKNKDAIYDRSTGSYGYWTALQKKFNLLLLTQKAQLTQMQTYYDSCQQNMSLYTDYSNLDKLQVYATWTDFLLPKEGYVEYGIAKAKNYTIKDYYQVKQYTTDDTYRVTLYAYWKNYSQACEANLNVLQNGGKLYSVRKEDFEDIGSDTEPSRNADYNVSSSSALVANGDTVSNKVRSHSVTPSGAASKYSIGALSDEVALIQKSRDDIVKKYSYEECFTDEEKLALDPFLIEGSFSDDSFIVTDSMKTKDYSDNSTKVEVIKENGDMVIKKIEDVTQTDTIVDDVYVAGQLVDAGYEKLKVVSQPSFSFELESANFLFIEKFKPFINQLLSIEKDKGSLFGSILNVQLEDENWVYPYLQEMEINYDDPDSFSMTFGNRFRMSSEEYTFDELHNETSSAVSSVGSLLSAVSQPVTNGTIDAVTQYTKVALTAANQSIRATKDNDFVFGGYGIKGRKKSNEDGNINGFSPEQLWITNNKICFTDDGWATTKAIFGKISVNGKDSYGLVADNIVGNLVMGNKLIISNSANTFTVDEDGLSISNDYTDIKLSPDIGIEVIKKTGAGATDVFQVDNRGNLTITGGRIVVGDGESMGYIIDGYNGSITSILKNDDGEPLFELTKDGHMNVSGLAIGGEDVPTPTDPITPSGSNGTVNDDPNAYVRGLTLLGRIASFFEMIFSSPYNSTLRWVGHSDSDGWRNIWKYYSSRTIQTMLQDIRNQGIYIVYSSDLTKAIADNNKTQEKVYVTRTVLNDYKPWEETNEILKTYQTKSDMSNYYTSTQVNNTFVTNSSLTQNYYSKSNINSIFNVSANTTTQWKTITVGSQQITVLTKTN